MKRLVLVLASFFMIGNLLLAPAVVTAGANSPAPSGSTGNQEFKDKACEGIQQSSAACDDTGLTQLIGRVIRIISFVVGAVSVLMVIVGGLRYVLSAGDANSAKAAKDTITYAVVGVIVAVLAWSIVTFVINAL